MTTRGQHTNIGYIIFGLALLFGGLIIVVKELNYLFLVLLLINVLAAKLFYRNFSKSLRKTAQLLLGVVFVYSGIVKGLDPLGTVFKIEDYFIAYDWLLLNPLAPTLALVLCLAEFIIGICLLFNLKPRLAAIGAALLMSVFTVTTLFDALYNMVPDCGCFGDAITLTNWQTFYKNLVLNVFTVIVVFNFFSLRNRRSNLGQWMTASIFALLFLGMELYSVNYLPPVDFRDWKVGTKFINDNPQPIDYYLTYKNSKTEETKEYSVAMVPYQDSTWLANWTFVSQRIDDPNPKMHDLQLIDDVEQDVTEVVLHSEEEFYLLIIYNMEKAKSRALTIVTEEGNRQLHNGKIVFLVTPSMGEELEHYITTYQPDFEILHADDIVLKTIIRSNPGIVVMEDGVVKEKIPWRRVEKK